MLSPSKNYKMSRAVKTMVATLWNHPQRNAIKRAFIEGELAAQIQPRKDKKPASDTPE